jgi:hypothetical protein
MVDEPDDGAEMTGISLATVENHFYALLAIQALFKAVAKHHGGEDRARRMIREAIAPISKRRRQEWVHWELLSRYDRMKPRPNVDLLAMQIFTEEVGLGDDRRTIESIERQISRAIQKRKAMQKRGRWRGPPWGDSKKR